MRGSGRVACAARPFAYAGRVATLTDSILVEASLAEAWDYYFEPSGWPAWVDGFDAVESASGYPEEGGTLVWRSTPAGRGTVSETRARPRAAHAAPDRLRRPGVARRADDDGSRSRARATRVTLELDYGCSPAARSPGSPSASSSAARCAKSLRRTLLRFRLEVEELAEMQAAAEARTARPLASRRLLLPSRISEDPNPMFVFKAAVVGAGTMGGEIAQAIASSDIPVVLKDIDQKFVDHGLEKAREVTKGQLDRLVKKEKLTQEQADARLEEVMGLIEGTTSYDSFGDVDFVIEAAPEKMEIKQQVYAELDAVTPGPRDPRLQHLVALDHRDGRRDPAAGEGRRLPLLLPGLGDAAGRDHRGRGHRPRGRPGRLQLRPGDPKQPITCGEVPGFVVNRILNSAVGEIWRAQEEQGLSIKKIDEAVARGERRADGPVLPRRPARPRHGPPRRRAPAASPTATRSTSTRGCRSWSPTASSARRPAAAASTRTASRRSRATPSPTARRSPS